MQKIPRDLLREHVFVPDSWKGGIAHNVFHVGFRSLPILLRISVD